MNNTGNPPLLAVEGLSVRYGPLAVLQDVSFTIEEGQWLMLVGPNGAGKTTLTHAILQSVPHTGRVLFEGKPLAKMRPKERALCVGMLTQNHHADYAFTVEEVVRLGRFAHSEGPLGNTFTEADAAAVEEALAATGMAAMRGQSVLTLSGGEVQRTFLAQLLAQNPRLLVLDEMANHLDLAYQKQTFALVQNWLQTPGRAVLSIMHDLSHAKAFGSHGLLLQGGRVAAFGTANNVLQAANLQAVYGMDVAGWMQKLLGQWA